jgi:hypothetical protein
LFNMTEVEPVVNIASSAVSVPAAAVAAAAVCLSPARRDGERGSLRDAYHVAAISLNNSAVSLLVHGECWDAMEILKDAIQFMEKAVVNRTKSHDEQQHEIEGDEDGPAIRRQALDRASRRTSRLLTHSDGLQQQMHNEKWPSLEVLSSQSDPSRILRSLSSIADSVSLNIAFPVTIDPIDFESCTIDDVSWDSGVVLYNYGIALDCAAVTGEGDFDDGAEPAAPMGFPRELIQVKAHNVFQNTYLVLFEIEQHCQGCMPICLASQIVLLRTMLTHNLINVSIKLNLASEYDYYCCIMQRLLLLVEAQQLLLPIDDRAVASAA